MEIGSSILSFETVLNILMSLPYLGVLVFAVYVATYFKERNPGREANMLMLGAVLQGLSYFGSHLMSYVILPMIPDYYSYVKMYYGIINLLGSAGLFLFLYGVLLYFKRTLNQQSSNKFGLQNDINSFIEKL